MTQPKMLRIHAAADGDLYGIDADGTLYVEGGAEWHITEDAPQSVVDALAKPSHPIADLYRARAE